MASRLWYATRERVKQSLDQKETARNDAQVDRAVESASRTVEGELHRLFYPQAATYSFPAPRGRSLFVDGSVSSDLIDADEVTVNGVATTAYTLLPVDGPPFPELRFDTPPGCSPLETHPIEIVGLWGYNNVTEPAGALAAAVADTTTTVVDVTDSSTVGVGSLLTVGTERMTVAARTMLTSGQTLTSDLDVSSAATRARVTDGAAFHVGEVLLVNAERLLVVDVAGNDLIVKRAWDGSILGAGGGVGGAHATGTALFALRRLTVERGVLGTVAATHLLAAPVLRQVYPGPVVAYVVALAQSELLNEVTGQQQAPAGHTFGTVLDATRERAIKACGRKAGFA